MMRLWFLAAICVVAATQQLTWYEHYERGEKAFERGEFAACIEDMATAIGEKPESRQDQFTRAVQKIEYKPYYYSALAHFRLDQLPEAFEQAQRAYAGEVVRDDPLLQSELAEILEAYRLWVDQQHQRFTQEDTIINERARLIRLLSEGETETVAQALAFLPEERFQDIAAYLDLSEGYREQVAAVEADVVRRIESGVNQGELAQARALLDAFADQLPDQISENLGIRLTTAERERDAREAARVEDLVVEPEPETTPSVDPELINELRDRWRNAESRGRELDSQVNTMRDQNRRLRDELAEARSGEATAPPQLMVSLSPRSGNIWLEASALSPLPISTWLLEIDGINTSIPPELERNDAGEVRVEGLFDAAYGEHQITLSIRDELGREAVVTRTITITRPWWRHPLVWFTPPVLLLLWLAFLLIGRRRRRRIALMRHFNPYIAGSPVRSEAMFYGRDELLQRIQNLVHKNSFMIHGSRRIGKTSLLLQLQQNLAALDAPDYHFHPAFIDLQGVHEEDLFHHMMGELLNDAEDWNLDLEALTFDDRDNRYQSRHFSRDMKHIIQQLNVDTNGRRGDGRRGDGRRALVVLLMDEVDVLNEFSEKTNQKLRGIFMKDFAENLSCVMAGIHLKKQWESSGSPWYNFFEEIPVSPIDESAARELILQPVRGVFRYDEDAVDLIIRETRGHPYLIQKLCVSLIGEKLKERHYIVQRQDVARELAKLNEETGRSKA